MDNGSKEALYNELMDSGIQNDEYLHSVRQQYNTHRYNNANRFKKTNVRCNTNSSIINFNKPSATLITTKLVEDRNINQPPEVRVKQYQNGLAGDETRMENLTPRLNNSKNQMFKSIDYTPHDHQSSKRDTVLILHTTIDNRPMDESLHIHEDSNIRSLVREYVHKYSISDNNIDHIVNIVSECIQNGVTERYVHINNNIIQNSNNILYDSFGQNDLQVEDVNEVSKDNSMHIDMNYDMYNIGYNNNIDSVDNSNIIDDNNMVYKNSIIKTNRDAGKDIYNDALYRVFKTIDIDNKGNIKTYEINLSSLDKRIKNILNDVFDMIDDNDSFSSIDYTYFYDTVVSSQRYNDILYIYNSL